MRTKGRSVLEGLAERALSLGADTLEVEYRDGHEEVVAMKGNVGVGIAQFPSNQPTAGRLRAELYALTSRKRRTIVAGHEVEMRAREYDSFGESAFSVELRRVEHADAADGARPPSRSLRQRRPLIRVVRRT